MLTTYLVAATVFIIFLIAVSLVFHFFKGINVIKTMLVVFAFSAPLILVFFPYFHSFQIENLLQQKYQVAILSTTAFVILWYVYMQIYGIIHGSISLSTLIYFYKSPKQTHTVSEFQKFQPFYNIIKTKFELMANLGLAKKSSSQNQKAIHQSPQGHLIGKIFYTFREFCHWRTD